MAGYLFDTTINILQHDLLRFPRPLAGVKLVCAHTGAFSLMLRNRMQREVDTNAALSRTLPRPIGDYLRRLYFDTVCFEPGFLRFATDGRAGRNICCWAATRRFRSASPIRSISCGDALPPEHAKLPCRRIFDRLTGR